MMANRGFDTITSVDMQESERERAGQYLKRAYTTLFSGILPFVTKQLSRLVALGSPNDGLYRNCLAAINSAAAVLQDPLFRRIVEEDPRHSCCSPRHASILMSLQATARGLRRSGSLAACSLLPA